MLLQKVHIINLKRIYNSENELLHRNEFVDENNKLHPNTDMLIAELLEMDCIETEGDPNVFFLTPEAYDHIEYLIQNPEEEDEKTEGTTINQLTEKAQRLGVSKVKKYVFLWLIASALLATAYKFLSPEDFKPQEKNPFKSGVIILDEDTQDHMEQELQRATDSLLNQ